MSDVRFVQKLRRKLMEFSEEDSRESDKTIQRLRLWIMILVITFFITLLFCVLFFVSIDIPISSPNFGSSYPQMGANDD